jgi:hypothetical protein
MDKLLFWQTVKDISQLKLGVHTRTADSWSRKIQKIGFLKSVFGNVIELQDSSNKLLTINSTLYIIIQQAKELNGSWETIKPQDIDGGMIIKSFGKFPFYKHTSFAIVSSVKKTMNGCYADLLIDNLDTYKSYWFKHDVQKFVIDNNPIKFNSGGYFKATDVSNPFYDEKFPHKCPHCGNAAYIGGMNNIDCKIKCKDSLK